MNKKSRRFLLTLLLGSLLLSSLPTIGQSGGRRSSRPSLPTLGAAVGELERIRNETRIAGPDLIVAENSVRCLEFTSHGLHYVPKRRDERMSDLSFRLELKAISSGQTLYRGKADERRSQPVNQGNEVSYSRPMGVTELYQALDSGVEQFFILEQNLSPASEDLWITSEVKTDLKPEGPRLRTSRGIVFYSGDQPVIRYGAATVIDANGRELRAELELDGERLSIVVNGAWLRQAAYPVVVDPFIGPLASIAAAGPHRWSPAMADDSSQHRYLVAWEQPVGDDFEIMGQLIDADGKPSACHPEPFSISLNPAGRDVSPEVTYDSTSRRFFVVWEDHGLATAGATASDYSLKGRFVGDPSGCAQVTPSGPALQISDAGGVIERAPDVAVGVASEASSRFLVVYLRATAGANAANVYGQMLNQDGSKCGGPVLIGGPSGFETRFHPSVAYGEPGVAEFFSVVYRSSDRTLKMARVVPTCGSSPPSQVIIDPLVADDPSPTGSATDVRPTIAYSRIGQQWLVNWIDYSSRVGAVLRWAQLPSALFWQNTFTTLLGAFRFVRGLSVTSSPRSPDLVVALAVGASPSGGFDIFLFHLQYSYDYFSANFRRDSLTGGGVNDWYPVVGSSLGRDDYFVVWQRELANGSSDIVGQSYVP